MLTDLTGHIHHSQRFDRIYHNTLLNRQEIVPVARKGKWGNLSRQSKMIVPMQFDQAQPFDANGFARVKKNSRDTTGKCVQDCP